MRAQVRNVKIDTKVKTKSNYDVFVEGMVGYTGKLIEVKRLPNPIGKEGWFSGVDCGWMWHKSWLKFVKPKPKRKSK